MRTRCFGWVTAALLVCAGGAADAQGIPASAQARLRQSLDARTFTAVTVVFDSARARGLPVEPLVNRALQATLHRTPGPVVHDAVSKLADRLGVARLALGAASSDAELAAGANALAVGVPRETLTQIRTLSPHRPVTVPLGVLTELVARDVAVNRGRDAAVSRASQMVVSLLRNGATPAQLVSLSDDVAHDVDAGIAPGAAFDIRARGVLGTLEQGVGESERALSMPSAGGRPGAAGATPPRAPRKP